MNTPATGYAHVKDGWIEVRTVSPTRIAAMVNAIVLLSTHSITPVAGMTDADVEALYADMRHIHGGNIKTVKINVVNSY